MNRIDTTDAARRFKRHLEEFTRQRVDKVQLGDMTAGKDGHRMREVHAEVAGQPKSYVAVESGGQVSLIDKSLGIDPVAAHQRMHADALTPSPSQAHGAANPGTNANGWPLRPPSQSHHAPAQGIARRR